MAASGAEPRRLGGGRSGLIAALVGLLLGGGGVALWSKAEGNARTDKAAARDYLLANPELLSEVAQELQDREAAAAVKAHRAAIETPFGGAWAGAKDGDVVLVEFFDYACSFCRASNAAIDRLLREDPKLKVVWRELPVLGADSQVAARASLAAAQHGDFHVFFRTLYGLGRPTGEAVAQAREAAGVTPDEVAKLAAADGELNRNYRLAEALRASGTPTFVVGTRVLHGAVGYERLKAAVAEARKQT